MHGFPKFVHGINCFIACDVGDGKLTHFMDAMGLKINNLRSQPHFPGTNYMNPEYFTLAATDLKP